MPTDFFITKENDLTFKNNNTIRIRTMPNFGKFK